MILESSYGKMSAHKKFQLKTKNDESAVDRYMLPRMTGMHNKPLTWHCSGPIHAIALRRVPFKSVNGFDIECFGGIGRAAESLWHFLQGPHIDFTCLWPGADHITAVYFGSLKANGGQLLL